MYTAQGTATKIIKNGHLRPFADMVIQLFAGQISGGYEEISKIWHLNWRQKVKKFFWRAHLPHMVYPIRIDPQNNVQLVNTQK